MVTMQKRMPLWVLMLTLLLTGALLIPVSVPGVQAQSATRTPTRSPTRTPTQVATPLPSPSPSATPGRGLRARVRRVILPAPSVKHNLVGDVVSDPDLPLSATYPTLFGDRIDFGMANFRDVTVGPDDGDGITALRFAILNMEGDEVFARDTTLAESFCAFGGTAEACAVHDFAAWGNRWPSGLLARSGRYTLIAFATGAKSDHKGTWTLNFELRLSSEGLQQSDGAALIRSVVVDGDELVLQIETLGFVPLAQGSHLHIFPGQVDEAAAIGGAAGRRTGVIEFPPDPSQGNATSETPAYGLYSVRVPLDRWPSYVRSVCVAVAHPDHTVLVGRGQCAALP
jgi:hypothetical protein